MKRIILATAFTFALGLVPVARADTPAPAGLAPSSNVAWTIDTLNLLRSGDPARGKTLNDTLECGSCHGEQGISGNDSWPNLAAQPAGYLFKMLKDYQDGKLSNTDRGQLMAFVVAEMSDRDMVDIAAYLAAQAPAPLLSTAAAKPARTLDLLGDPARLIPPCSICHGEKAEGDFPDFPALAGQPVPYLKRAMHEFGSGARGNDIYSRMRLIAGKLTPAEIAALANYFAAGGIRAAQD